MKATQYTQDNESQMKRVISKLNSLLGKRFGVIVEFISVTEKGEASAAVHTVRRNANAPMIVAHNQLIIPMRADGSLAGAARVSNINSLSPKDLDQIRQTVDLILSEVIAAHSKLDLLEATEAHLQQGIANVFSLDDKRLFLKSIAKAPGI